MASIWTCHLSYDAVAVTFNTEGNPDSNSHFYRIYFETICLPSGDLLPPFNAPVDDGHFALAVGVESDGSASMVPVFQFGTPDVMPGLWGSSVHFPGIFGQPAANFTSGGTLTITKDYDGDLLTFTSPVGTISGPLSVIGFRNTTPMRPQGISAEFTLADPTFSFPEYAVDYVTKFYNLIAQENGVTYQTVALSAADPGLFYPDAGSAFLPGVGGVDGVLAPFWTATQETSRLKLEAQVTVPDFPLYRIFDFLRNQKAPVTTGFRLTSAPEHGSIYGALVYAADSGTVRFRGTYDSGRTWAETNLFSDSATTNETPALAWSGGKLYAVWRKNTVLVQSVSSDLGATWGVPVALAITGTNPFLLVDPRHGLQYYFYLDGTFNLQLVRSADFGQTFIDGSPHLVAATIGQQTIAAEFASDGSLLVGYIVAGAWTQRRSKDLGLTWS